jgi:hypothetical protein
MMYKYIHVYIYIDGSNFFLTPILLGPMYVKIYIHLLCINIYVYIYTGEDQPLNDYAVYGSSRHMSNADTMIPYIER